jgi:hypothetical protein
MALSLALDILVVALSAWFWRDCARPALTAQRASPIAHWLVLGVTVLTIFAYALFAVDDLAQFLGPTRWWIALITGALWISVVGLGYLQNYALLLRLTRGNRPPHPN